MNYVVQIAELNPKVLLRDLQTAGLPELTNVNKSMDSDDVALTFAETLSEQERATMEAVCAAHDPEPLWWAQETALDGINGETEFRIIGPWGFEWPADSGNRFSLSLASQTKWTGLYNGRNAITYPYTIRTKDDAMAYAIADAAEVEQIYSKLVSDVAAILEAGATAKQTVKDATTVAGAWAAMNAYVETRPPKP